MAYYYHVRIAYTLAGTAKRLRCFRTDLSERFVKTKITGPFTDNVGLRIGDEISEEDSVHDVAVFRSEQTFSELLHEARRKYDLNAESDDVWFYLLEGKLAENVTNRFIRSGKTQEIESAKRISRNVFIVHGRDHAPMKELKTMLYDFGLNPIVLHEEASGGLTLPEKLERHAKDVGYAFAILTPDDIGGEKATIRKRLGDGLPLHLIEPSIINRMLDGMLNNFEPRARQNVIFEMGYFWGLLERKKVCCLLKGDVEKPSDMEGIVYISFKDSVYDVQVKIMKELKEAGYEIKL